MATLLKNYKQALKRNNFTKAQSIEQEFIEAAQELSWEERDLLIENLTKLGVM